MNHAELVKAAKRAIEAVMGDTSVPATMTRSSLEELQSDLEIMVESLPAADDEADDEGGA